MYSQFLIKRDGKWIGQVWEHYGEYGSELVHETAPSDDATLAWLATSVWIQDHRKVEAQS